MDKKIEAIGEVSLESKEAIDEARSAYNGLTEEQKGYVTKLDTLEAAEVAYMELLDDQKQEPTEDPSEGPSGIPSEEILSGNDNDGNVPSRGNHGNENSTDGSVSESPKTSDSMQPGVWVGICAAALAAALAAGKTASKKIKK